jgi:hypothetical protein
LGDKAYLAQWQTSITGIFQQADRRERGDVLSVASGVRWLKTEQVKRLKDLELENRLRKAVSDLTLDKLILQEAARGNF